MSKSLSKLYTNTLTKKHWHNDGRFCNGKTHPTITGYRRYKRGKNRCLECGAKFGKSSYSRKTYQEMIVDNIFSPNPIFELLNKKVT